MKTILFQGDSITDCGRSRENEVMIGTGYPLFLKAQLGFENPNEWQFYNRGVSGNRIVDLYARMKEDIINYLLCTRESRLPDQDALNVVYKDKVLLLDNSWNCFAMNVHSKGEQALQPKIYHYAGWRCVLYLMTEMDYLYYETMYRTPWGEEKCSEILKKSMARIVDRTSQLEKLLSNISNSQKKRIYYGNETIAMRSLYSLLSVKDGDYRISSSDMDNNDIILPCKNFEAILNETDDFVVFVMPDADGGKAIQKLEEIGLKNGKDFFVIPRLLVPHLVGYI